MFALFLFSDKNDKCSVTTVTEEVSFTRRNGKVCTSIEPVEFSICNGSCPGGQVCTDDQYDIVLSLHTIVNGLLVTVDII